MLVAATVARAEQETTDAAARLGRLIDAGEKEKDVELAISAINSGLKLVDELQPWPLQRPRAQTKASLLVSLGRKYRQRRLGVHADNLELAIGSFRQALAEVSQDDVPALRCRIQYNLGLVLADRVRGSSIENIEASIAALQTVEACYPGKEYPEQWSMLQRSIARAYHVRVLGNRADNLERAVAGYKAALSVAKPQPESLARTQTYLGDALVLRIRGDHAANVEEAIKAYNAALTVRTQDRLPELWASTQFGLARAHVERTEGDRAENIEQAIALYKSALSVRTFEAMPRQYAATQLNLANTYRIRVRGTFDENVEQAIEAYKSALRVYMKETSPRPWAIAKHTLAATLTLRKTGDPRQNLAEAIDAYRDALSVVSRDANPRDHLVISRGLARALMLNRDWQAAREAYAEAVGTFRLIFNEASDDEAEASALISTTGPTFDEAAYVSATLGDLNDAFRLLNEGRGRLLSLALREQTTALSLEERVKRKELVAEILRWTGWAETAEGPERILAIERAASLRQQLHASTKVATPDAETAKRTLTNLLNRALERSRAVVAPIVTEAGARVLVAIASNGTHSIFAIDFPELTTLRVNEYLYGQKRDVTQGWIGAYFAQYLSAPAQRRRIGEWRKAVEDVGPALWALLAGRLESELRRLGLADGDQIVWMPSQALGLLPIGLARAGADGREFGKSFVIVHAPNLDVIASASRHLAEVQGPSLAAVVNPTGSSPELNLPFAEIEGRIVTSYFPAGSVAKFDERTASPNAVLGALVSKTYWHFASHGRFDWRDARRSSLSLKDNAQLTIGQLLEAREATMRPRLVVLSACETGLYDSRQNPEEFVGLPATFMRLGSAGVLGTLWLVDDVATAFLMMKFYELHLRDGLEPPSALRQAQGWLRTATKAELLQAMREAGRTSGVDSSKISKLESAIKSRRRSRDGRFSELWNQIQSLPTLVQRRFQSRPFSHPLFWGGFVYTGL